MAAKNNITGDLLVSKLSNKNYASNFDSIFPEKKIVLTIEGQTFEKCGKRCWAEVKDNHFVCNKPNCSVL